ncbi:hypothetical protein B0H12DRAFT_1243295 [Mycena haematopus]|nr:hypothetical protein B0H12DRAFT_1243295 [Mycena haematopus]
MAIALARCVSPSSGGLRPLYHRAGIHPVHVDVDPRVVAAMARMLEGPRSAYSLAASPVRAPQRPPPRRSYRIPARAGTPSRLGLSGLRLPVKHRLCTLTWTRASSCTSDWRGRDVIAGGDAYSFCSSTGRRLVCTTATPTSALHLPSERPKGSPVAPLVFQRARGHHLVLGWAVCATHAPAPAHARGRRLDEERAAPLVQAALTIPPSRRSYSSAHGDTTSTLAGLCGREVPSARPPAHTSARALA